MARLKESVFTLTVFPAGGIGSAVSESCRSISCTSLSDISHRGHGLLVRLPDADDRVPTHVNEALSLKKWIKHRLSNIWIQLREVFYSVIQFKL